MIKQVYQLPEIFFDGQVSDVNLYFYHANTSSQHNKVCFGQNLICFLLDGHKEVASGEDHVSIGSDRLLLLNAGNALMTEKVSLDRDFRSVLLFFSGEFLIDLISRNRIGLNQKRPAQHLFAFIKDEYILNFEKSLLLLERGAVRNEQLLRSKTEDILLYLFEKERDSMVAFVQAALNEHKDIAFRQVIENQPDFNLGVEELAFLCHMSSSAFKRKFSEVFHTSPKQYFIAQKMNKAKVLLKQHKRPSEICFELGYHSLSAFSNEFRKHFGTSPKYWMNEEGITVS